MSEQPEPISRSRKIALGVLFAVLAVLLSGPVGWSFLVSLTMPPVYRADPIEGRVVDAETRAPVEHAHVLAMWGLENLVGNYAGCANVVDAVTDRDGRFVIPGWGPRLRWPLWVSSDGLSPFITIFKPGYLLFSHPDLSHSPWSASWDSNLDGATIPMSRAPDSASYAEIVDPVADSLAGRPGCDWTNAQTFAHAMRDAVSADKRYPWDGVITP